jgi:beta-lactamase regulating signal transducer with metallopeptidase domain
MMLASLLRASVTGAVGVGLVWLLCRLVPRLSASTRATLWWCVAAKFVIGLVWFVPPVRLPILPAMPTYRVVVSSAGSGQSTGVPRGSRPIAPAVVALDRSDDLITRPPAVLPQRIARISALTRWLYGTAIRGFSDRVLGPSATYLPTGTRGLWWSDVLLAVWALGVALAIGIGMRHSRRASALIVRSTDAPEHLRAIVVDLSSRLMLSRVPTVRTSEDIETPLVIGLRHGAILVPERAFARLSERQQQMALCHELAHIKRADLQFGCVPALAEALFFFHPLVKLAASEYALSREAACDATVLDALDAPPNEYGRLLLDLGLAPARMGLSVAGMSSGSAFLKRRLVMLDAGTEIASRSRVLAAAIVCVALIAMVPMKLVARPSTAPTTITVWMAQMSVPASATPGSSRFTARLDYMLFHDDSSVTVGHAVPVRVMDSQAKRAATQLIPFRIPTKTTDQMGDAIAHARSLAKPGETTLWFRQSGREYVVRDPATLRELEALWKSQRVAVTLPGQPVARSPAAARTDADRARGRKCKR